MEELTEDKLFAFVRLLKENKPFPSVSQGKVNHWIELINIILDNKLKSLFTALQKDSQTIKFKTVIEVLTIEEFDKKLNSFEIKSNRILSSNLKEDGKIEIAYTKKIGDDGDDKNK